MVETKLFKGKYQLQAPGGAWLNLDTKNQSVTLTKEAGGDSRINFYQTTDECCVIQAMNGMYLIQTEDSIYKVCEEDWRESENFFAEFHAKGEKEAKICFYSLLSDGRRVYIDTAKGQVLPCVRDTGQQPPDSVWFTGRRLCCDLDELMASRGEGMDLSWADLSKTDLTGIDLRKITARHVDFSDSNLTSALLAEGDFSQSNFLCAVLNDVQAGAAGLEDCVFYKSKCLNMGADNAVFTGSSLEYSDLRNVSFFGSNLSGCTLRYCNLTYASLAYADLRGTDLTGSELSMVDFSNMKVSSGTVFNEVSAESSSFVDLNLEGISMAHANLAHSYFDGTNLKKADLSYADLLECSFLEGVVLSGATLANSRLQGADFTGAQLGFTSDASVKAADLTGAYMYNTNMKEANLNGVNMGGVSWYGTAATSESAQMQLVDFSNANLSGMKFGQTDLYGCKFDYANLINTDFSGANLRPASNNTTVSFAYANIQGTDFFQSQIVDAVFTNAAAAMPIHLYFSIEEAASYRADLNSETLSSAIREQFAKNDCLLPKDAAVKLRVQDYYWTIESGNKSIYVITSENSVLMVRGGVQGVHLFNADDQDGTILKELLKIKTAKDRIPVPKALQTAFFDAGYKLRSYADVSLLETGDTWLITNYIEEDPELRKDYLEFCVSASKENSLYIYGTILSTVYVGIGHVYAQKTDFLEMTKWVPDLLLGDSICPCGQNVSVLCDPRTAVRKTWEDAVTANRLPKEPDCIPGGLSWCIPQGGGRTWI